MSEHFECPSCGGYWVDIAAFEKHGELHDAMHLRRLIDKYPTYPNATPQFVWFLEALIAAAQDRRIINT